MRKIKFREVKYHEQEIAFKGLETRFKLRSFWVHLLYTTPQHLWRGKKYAWAYVNRYTHIYLSIYHLSIWYIYGHTYGCCRNQHPYSCWGEHPHFYELPEQQWMPLTHWLQTYKLKKVASDHKKCPLKHLIPWTQIRKFPTVHLRQCLYSNQEPNPIIWSCQTLQKARKQCMKSHQQNSSRNISTALVLVLPLLSPKLLWGWGTGNQTCKDRKETKGMKQFWQTLKDGEMKGKRLISSVQRSLIEKKKNNSGN